VGNGTPHYLSYPVILEFKVITKYQVNQAVVVSVKAYKKPHFCVINAHYLPTYLVDNFPEA
jgi:hypothetical protein